MRGSPPLSNGRGIARRGVYWNEGEWRSAVFSPRNVWSVARGAPVIWASKFRRLSVSAG